MAALLAILKALRRAVGRDLGTFGSIKVNNLFLFVALLSYGALNSGLPPKSAYPFFVLMGFLLLFPMSSDPLGKLPPARLGLWPLTAGQRVGLRLASMALSPVVWIGVLILARTASPLAALAFCGVAAGMQGAAALSRRAIQRDPHWNLLRHIPRIPGRLGGLVRKNIRELLSLLDPYAALLMSIGGGAYRLIAPHPDPEAFAIIGLLVALTMSTYAQSLFGLELGSGSGMTRYDLLPLRGWEILLAKDAAFLAVLLIMLLPLDPGAGMTFGQGDIAAVGYMVDSCRKCPSCLAGQEQYCENFMTLTYNGEDKILGGVTYGGYSDSVAVDETYALRVPNGLDPAGAAPLLCAGITTYSPLRHIDMQGNKRGNAKPLVSSVSVVSSYLRPRIISAI